jgi:hypothetical protein
MPFGEPMVAGVCSCCGYLGECVEFVGMRTLLICCDCGRRAAERAQPMLPIAPLPVPKPKPPAREMRRSTAPARRRAG